MPAVGRRGRFTMAAAIAGQAEYVDDSSDGAPRETPTGVVQGGVPRGGAPPSSSRCPLVSAVFLDAAEAIERREGTQ